MQDFFFDAAYFYVAVSTRIFVRRFFVLNGSTKQKNSLWNSNN